MSAPSRVRALALPWLSASCLLMVTSCNESVDDLPTASDQGAAAQEQSSATSTDSADPAALQAGSSACTAPLKPGDDRLCEYSLGGKQRKFYVYAPPSFDPSKPATLIVDNHGLSESAEVHTGKASFSANRPKGYGSGWRRAIQGDNAIVATPQGLNNSWNQQTDIPYLNDVADKIEKMADIDKERVYITGISMGGMMTFATGCADTKRWRGMASIATLSTACPKIARPVPLISFHSETDTLTSYPNDRKGTEAVAKQNNCKRGPTPLATFGGANSSPLPFCFKNPPKDGGPDATDPYNIPMAPCPTSAKVSTCIQWDQCDEDVKVVFCTVSAASQYLGGHLLYTNDTGLNVAVMAWDFLKQFQK